MKIYHYDRITKHYTGASTADLMPHSKKDYCIPAFATTVKPPKDKPGFIPKWIGEKWELDNIADEIAQGVRRERDSLLSACDWTQLADVAPSSDWIIYRQALRDITKQKGFPLNIVWPENPGA